MLPISLCFFLDGEEDVESMILLALIIRDAIFLDIDSDDFLDDVGEK